MAWAWQGLYFAAGSGITASACVVLRAVAFDAKQAAVGSSPDQKSARLWSRPLWLQ